MLASEQQCRAAAGCRKLAMRTQPPGGLTLDVVLCQAAAAIRSFAWLHALLEGRARKHRVGRWGAAGYEQPEGRCRGAAVLVQGARPLPVGRAPLLRRQRGRQGIGCAHLVLAWFAGALLSDSRALESRIALLVTVALVRPTCV